MFTVNDLFGSHAVVLTGTSRVVARGMERANTGPKVKASKPAAAKPAKRVPHNKLEPAVAKARKKASDNARHRRAYAKNPAKSKAKAKAWRDQNPERYQLVQAAAERAWRQRNPEKYAEIRRAGRQRRAIAASMAALARIAANLAASPSRR